MSTKPIEVGCRVIVVRDDFGPENVGKVGNVIGFSDTTPEGHVYIVDRVWEVESLSSNFNVYYSDGEIAEKSKCKWYYQTSLLRLPDEDEVEKFDKEKELEEV